MKTLKLNNLRKALLNNVKKQHNGNREMIKEIKTLDEINDTWMIRQYLTDVTKKKGYFKTIDDAKKYLLNRIDKQEQKRIEKEITHFETVLSSGKLIECTISVNWVNSRTWGANPNATAEAVYLDAEGNRRYIRTESGSITGCGYCKLSTAVASALNQINPILRSLYIGKNKDVKKPNGDIFGYGSGSYVLPRIEGGVGVSCYPRIFESIGYKFETIATGKMFDVFKITKA